MSTGALISVEQQDGTYTTIYNHSDGYPSYLGEKLLHHYNSEQLANALVALGDASFIDDKLAPDTSGALLWRYSEWSMHVL